MKEQTKIINPDHEQEESLDDYDLEEVEESLNNFGSDAIKELEQIPDIASEEWSDYVIRQLREDEIPDGNPTADGLRRLAELLLGRIVYSVSKVHTAPTIQNGYHATVEHVIKIQDGTGDDMLTFGDVADVHPGNTPDEKYARHAAATAATRAEGRALRKALHLRRVITAEETTPEDDQTEEGKIKQGQIFLMDMISSRIDVNLWSFINAGSQKYEKITDIDYEVASKMIQKLSDWQNDRSKIKLELKGYDKQWRKEKS